MSPNKIIIFFVILIAGSIGSILFIGVMHKFFDSLYEVSPPTTQAFLNETRKSFDIITGIQDLVDNIKNYITIIVIIVAFLIGLILYIKRNQNSGV